MKRTMVAALALALWGLGLAGPAQAQQLVRAENPETIRALFAGWGYNPTPIRIVDGLPLFEANINGLSNAVVLGGCTNARNCTHIVLVATYDDVPNPPFEWLNAQTFNYNLVAAMRREDGLLTLRTSVMLGAEGVPASVIRAAIEDWVLVNGEIAQSAINAGYARE